MGNGTESEQPTSRSTSRSMSIEDLVEAEKQGLDLNKLLFARHLTFTRWNTALTETFPVEQTLMDAESPSASTPPETPNAVPIIPEFTEEQARRIAYIRQQLQLGKLGDEISRTQQKLNDDSKKPRPTGT